jgi:hypothetical protein
LSDCRRGPGVDGVGLRGNRRASLHGGPIW